MQGITHRNIGGFPHDLPVFLIILYTMGPINFSTEVLNQHAMTVTEDLVRVGLVVLK